MKKIIPIVVAAALVAGGFILIKHKKAELEKLHPPKIYPEVVKTMKPRLSHFHLTLTALGIIKSGANVNISTKIASRIISMKPLGSMVKRGDIIAKLDSSSTQSKISAAKMALQSLYSKLHSAKLSLRNMILTHKRTKELLSVKGASIEQYQKEENAISSIKSNIASLRAQIKSTKATLRELNTLLGYTIIRSPITGIISKRFLNPGDIAMPGRPICEVSSKSGKYILIALPDNIKPKGIVFHGKIYNVFPLNSTVNGLEEYKANVDTSLSAGSRVEIGIVVFNGNAIKLPVDAILSDNGKNYVLIVKDHRAIPKQVHIIASGEEGIAIRNNGILGKNIVLAKPDILIKLLGGVRVIREK